MGVGVCAGGGECKCRRVEVMMSDIFVYVCVVGVVCVVSVCEVVRVVCPLCVVCRVCMYVSLYNCLMHT